MALTATAVGCVTVAAAPRVAGAAISVTATVDADCMVTIHGSGFTSADLDSGSTVIIVDADQAFVTHAVSVDAAEVLDDGAFDVTWNQREAGAFNFLVRGGSTGDGTLATGSIDTGCAVVTANLASEGLVIDTGQAAVLNNEYVLTAEVAVEVDGMVCSFIFEAEAHGPLLIGLADAQGSCGVKPSGTASPTGAATLTSVGYWRGGPLGSLNDGDVLASPNLAGTSAACGDTVCITFPEDTTEVGTDRCPITMPSGLAIDQLCPPLTFTFDPAGAALTGIDQATLVDLGAEIGDQLRVTAVVTVNTVDGTPMRCEVTGPATVGADLVLTAAGRFVGPCNPSFFGETAVTSAILEGYIVYLPDGAGSFDLASVTAEFLTEIDCADPTSSCVYGFSDFELPPQLPSLVLPATPSPPAPDYTG